MKKQTVGAKSKYDTHIKANFNKITDMLYNGLTNKEICKNIKITQDTFYRYLREHPELKEIINNGKKIQIEVVENALFKNALGQTITETQETFNKKGELIRTVKTTKELPPNTSAIIFYLKNRAGAKWKDRNIQEASLVDNLSPLANLINKPIIVNNLPNAEKVNEKLLNYVNDNDNKTIKH